MALDSLEFLGPRSYLVPVQRVHSPEDSVFTFFESLQTKFQSIAFPYYVGVPVIDAIPSLVSNFDGIEYSFHPFVERKTDHARSLG